MGDSKKCKCESGKLSGKLLKDLDNEISSKNMINEIATIQALAIFLDNNIEKIKRGLTKFFAKEKLTAELRNVIKILFNMQNEQLFKFINEFKKD